MRLVRWVLLAMVGGLCACATPLPAGTLTLAEVAHVATHAEATHGVRVDGEHMVVAPSRIAACGLAAGTLDDGRFIVVRFFVFWVSRVPESVMGWAMVPPGTQAAVGNLVEIETGPRRDGDHCPTLHRVRAPSLPAAGCGYALDVRSGAGAVASSLTGVLNAIGTGGGRPGSMSISCVPGQLQSEGWTRMDAGPFGAAVWRKMPSR